MKKFLIFFSALSIFAFAGCNLLQPESDEQQPAAPSDQPQSSTTLRMLYSEWPPDMMAFLAQEKGFFKEQGVDVELVWVDGFEENVATRMAGGTDVWNYTLLDFITEYADGTEKDGQVFLIEDFSAGADAVVVNSDEIQSMSDLKGKNVGVEVGTIGEFFLNILLQKEGLTLDDVNAIDAGFDAIPGMLADGTIDAGITYEPAISEAVAGGARVLVDSSQERGTIVDVYVAKKDHLAAHPNEYKALIKALLQANDYYNSNPEESAEIIKDKLGMTTEEVVETFEGLRLVDLRDNLTAFDRNSGHSSLYNLSQLAQQYLEDQGVLDEPFPLDPLLNSNLIESI